MPSFHKEVNQDKESYILYMVAALSVVKRLFDIIPFVYNIKTNIYLNFVNFYSQVSIPGYFGALPS